MIGIIFGLCMIFVIYGTIKITYHAYMINKYEILRIKHIEIINLCKILKGV